MLPVQKLVFLRSVIDCTQPSGAKQLLASKTAGNDRVALSDQADRILHEVANTSLPSVASVTGMDRAVGRYPLKHR